MTRDPIASSVLVAFHVLVWFPRLRIVTLLFGVAALALALSFLLKKDILLDEGGTRGTITDYGLGFWLWIASIVLAIGGGLVTAMRRRNHS